MLLKRDIKIMFQELPMINLMYHRGRVVQYHPIRKYNLTWIEIQDGFYFMLEPPGKAITLWLALDKVI